MPRPRVKTRVEHLADCHTFLIRAQQCLQEVDLRTTSGQLRESIREGRDLTAEALASVQDAIRNDTPKR